MKKIYTSLKVLITIIISLSLLNINAQVSESKVNSEYVKYVNNVKSGSLKKTKLGYVLSEIPMETTPYFTTKQVVQRDFIDKSLPSSFDLRSSGNVTSVKNQGPCGDCWAFATMGAIESNWKLLGLGNFDLSEDNLNNCQNFDYGPCNGGNPTMSAVYFSNRVGPINETDDPYSDTIGAGICPSGLTPIAYIPEVRFLSKTDLNSVKQALTDYGALYVNMCWDDAYFNSSNNTYYYDGVANTNHGVTLVGWDDNKLTDGGTGAWIIKNSWGTSWGESGYFYISYNDTKVLSTIAYFPTKLEYKSNDKIYSRDEFGWVSNIGYTGKDSAYALVKYTATGNQLINKISLWINTSASNADIEIYDDFNGTTLSNQLAIINNNSFAFPGLYNINIPTPIYISSGNDFYIKVKYKTPSNTKPIPVEKVSIGYSSAATIGDSVCWISSTGTSWLSIGNSTGYKYDLTIRVYASSNPIANYTESTSSACKNTTINFTNTSINSTTYKWYIDNVEKSATTNYSFTFTDAGSYNVKLVAQNSDLKDSITKTITINDLPLADAGSNITICNGNSTQLTATGGTSFVWNNGATNSIINVTPTINTTYSITVTDSNGCTNTDNVTINVSPIPNADTNNTQTICYGGTARLRAYNASNYLWSNGGTNYLITVSPKSTITYTVTASNSAECSITSSAVVTVINPPTADAGNNTSICYGNNIKLTATGGNSYSWNTGSSSDTITVKPLVNTTYTVTATNNCGSGSDNIVISINPLPTVDANNSQTICVGGTARLRAYGASTYTWSNGGTNYLITVSPKSTVTYTVTATSSAGCSIVSSDIVTVYNNPTADAGTNKTICIGNQVSLSVTGGSSYLWSNNQTTSTIIVSPTTNTTYFVTSTNNCGTATDFVNVTVIPLPLADAGTDKTICYGGSFSLTASGGTYYLWGNGTTNATMYGGLFTSKNFHVTVTNSFGCSANDSVRVIVTQLPTVEATTNHSICYGKSDTIKATGTNVISFMWNENIISSTYIVMPSSTTTYTVTANGLCGTATDNVILTVIPMPIIDAGIDKTLCKGNGIDLLASSNCTYLWGNGRTTALNRVAPQTTTKFFVTATNSCGTEKDSVLATVIPLPTIDAGTDKTICKGSGINLLASSNCTYLWGNGRTTALNRVAPQTTTKFFVTATNSCGSTKDSVLVTVSTVTADAGTDKTICYGSSFALKASGGTSYLWGNGSTNATMYGGLFASKTFYVTVTNSFGCSAKDSVRVTVSTITADAGSNKSICYGNNTSLTASGGSYYLWSNGQTGATITINPIVNTTYKVTVTNNNNCTAKDSVVVNINPLPIADAGQDKTICYGGSFALKASGGISYLWGNGTTNATMYGGLFASKTFYVTVTNSNGCSAKDSVRVTVNTPIADAGSNQTVCKGDSTNISATGGNTYLWSNGQTNSTFTVSPTVNSTYYVTVTNSYNCSATDIVKISIPAIAEAGPSYSICRGKSATISATGDGNFLWSNGATTSTITVSPTVYNMYYLTVTSSNGCTSTDRTSVSVYNQATVDAGANSTIAVGASKVLTATGTSIGTYNWSNGATTSSTTVNPSTTTIYKVTVNNNYNCSAVDSVTVTVGSASININMGFDNNTSANTNLIIYPNPVRDYLSIETEMKDAIVNIYNIEGKLLRNFKIYDNKTIIDFGEFSKGIYNIEIMNSQTIKHTKIIKQ